MLYYTSTMLTDTKEKIITNISAEHTSKKDSQLLIKNTRKNLSKLEQVGLDVKRILADEDFSSGENYVMLEEMGIEAFITLHGTYEPHRAGFKYDGRRHAFRCQNGQIFLIRL